MSMKRVLFGHVLPAIVAIMAANQVPVIRNLTGRGA